MPRRHIAFAADLFPEARDGGPILDLRQEPPASPRRGRQTQIDIAGPD